MKKKHKWILAILIILLLILLSAAVCIYLRKTYNPFDYYNF